MTLKLATTDLRDVAAKAAEMAQPGIEAKQQVLTLAMPSEPAMVKGDEVRLAQVLSNLLNNASLYSPSVGCIELELSRIGSEWVVTVSDQGIGMSAKTISTAFDMFVQGGRSQELAPGGLGLGLAVARALAEIHGGRLSADSDGEGRGSRFRLWLPAATEKDTVVEPVATVAAPTEVQGLRVLVVDDNSDLADVIAETFSDAGHDVRVVYHPEAAIELVRQFTPQVALLDIGLPTMDGYQLAERLRAILPETPRLIAMSGFGQERDREKSRAHGFQTHFVKPADLDQLLAAIGDGH